MAVCWFLGGLAALCAVLYLLGWERGRRGATVHKSVRQWLAGRNGKRAESAGDAESAARDLSRLPFAGGDAGGQELLNFLQYDGSAQPPLDGGKHEN